jgi:hypothetical protein|tara:strand:+ start:529 stop:795 length:267 start_codon:yes stop_codon:yes gene_type:complete
MGQKSRTSQTSKGERRNVAKWVTKANRRSYLTGNNGITRTDNQIKAFLKGKKVMVTIANPITTETNKPFIRVNAKDIWKTGSFSIKNG